MNNLQEIYNGYLAVELEKRKIAKKYAIKNVLFAGLKNKSKNLNINAIQMVGLNAW